MAYTNKTDETTIKKQISKKLEKEDNAIAAMGVVSNLAALLDPKNNNNDPINQWLSALNNPDHGLQNSGKAAKVQNTTFIEIYPSGTKGKGGSDRLLLSVTNDTVEITKAAKSKH